MPGRAASIGVALSAAGVFMTTVASAQERRGPAGPVVVREVQVNEVRVPETTRPRLDDQRPILQKTIAGLNVGPAFAARRVLRHLRRRIQRNRRMIARLRRCGRGRQECCGGQYEKKCGSGHDCCAPGMID